MELKENKALAKKLNWVAYFLTAAVLVLVGLMRRVKIDTDIDFSFLPPFHASFNAIVAFALIMALINIKKKNITSHRNWIFVAMTFSAMFLISYVLYHFTNEEVKFCKEGSIRTFYFIFLISHIVLAGLSLPFILFTFIRGFTYQVEKHKKMARWVYPIWLYVAISGPICYLLLRPCY